MDPKLRVLHRNEDCVLGWGKKYALIFTSLKLKYSIPFNSECRQQTTLMSAIFMPLTSIEKHTCCPERQL